MATPINIPLSTITDSVSSLQTVVDDFTSKNQSLYSQRDALKAQVLALNLQLNDVNAEIALLETSDVKKAKASIRALEMINSGAGGPAFSRLGF